MWKRLCRNARWWLERRRRGWDEREVWELHVTAAAFLAPRLELLRDGAHGYPFRDDMDEETWFAVLDKMAQAFRFVACDDWDETEAPARASFIDEGLALFAEFYLDLWD